MKGNKKQRISYIEDANIKAAELEETLFGREVDSVEFFRREKENADETVADLVKQATRGGLLLDSDIFFEDAGGEAAVESSTSGDDDDDGDNSSSDDDGDDDHTGGAAKKRVQHAKKALGDGRKRRGEELAEGADAPSSSGTDSGTGEDEDGQEQVSPSDHSDQGDEDGDSEDAAAAAEEDTARARGSSAGAEPAGRKEAGGAQAWGASARPGGGRGAAAWSDPHDAEVTVGVASQARLRKLRSSDKQTEMDGTEYEAALRRQHQALNPRTRWAKKQSRDTTGQGNNDEDNVEGEAEALLARAGGLTERPVGHRLPAGQIETTRLKDANQHQPSDAVVQAVQFHANGQLLLTAGLDKKLRLFQVDGLRNPLVQAVHLEDLPITAAAFAQTSAGSSSSSVASGLGGGAPGTGTSGGDCVVLAGRRSFFYLYDMAAARLERVAGPAGCGLKSLESFAVAPASTSALSSEPLVAFIGDGGAIPLVSLRTRQCVTSLKMSGNVRALAFDREGRELVSTGDDGIVHIWDLRTRRCRLTFIDSGNIGDASSLALSADGTYLATGAKSGVVNVYRRGEVEAAAARASSGAVVGAAAGRVAVAPERELLNLTTNVDTLCFSPDSQILGYASRMKRDALRLVHLPSLTVFSNWPTGRTPLHYVHSLDFSPNCGLLAIGNAKGRALLYRLHHYKQA